MTTFNSRSRCERKQLNRHFRFSWDSTLCPTSAVWGSFYHKSRAVLPHPHWDPKSPILQWLPAFFFFFFLLQTEALERSLGNSVWSWCSKPSLYRLARRPSQHPELWAQKATPLASLWCLPHPHPPLQDVLWCQDTAVLMPTGICCCCCCCCVHNDLCLKIL